MIVTWGSPDRLAKHCDYSESLKDWPGETLRNLRSGASYKTRSDSDGGLGGRLLIVPSGRPILSRFPSDGRLIRMR